jgi:glycosyltransferase involved in cell wall biosynthesis
MPEVLSRVSEAKLILAIRQDDLRYEQQLHSLVQELRLEDHIEFRLNVGEPEKRELLQASRVLVVPSAVEGFGIVVLEANACGVPVVASSGVPEGAVSDGVNGVRYRFGDTQALSEAIISLLLDDGLYSSLHRNALANAKRFAWSRVGAEFERVVVSAAAANSHPHRIAQ